MPSSEYGTHILVPNKPLCFLQGHVLTLDKNASFRARCLLQGPMLTSGPKTVVKDFFRIPKIYPLVSLQAIQTCPSPSHPSPPPLQSSEEREIKAIPAQKRHYFWPGKVLVNSSIIICYYHFFFLFEKLVGRALKVWFSMRNIYSNAIIGKNFWFIHQF